MILCVLLLPQFICSIIILWGFYKIYDIKRKIKNYIQYTYNTMEPEKLLEKTMEEIGITEPPLEKRRAKKPDLDLVENKNSDDEYYKGQLMILVASGRSDELLGKKITLRDVEEKLTPSEIKKYYKLCESNLANKINSNIANCCVMIFSQVINKALPIDDVDKLADDLRNDYILQSELKNISGIISLRFGKTMALVSAGLITLKHTVFARKTKEKQNELGTIGDLS